MAHTQHSYTPIIHTKRVQQGYEPRVTLEELESILMNAGYGYQAGEVRAPNGLPLTGNPCGHPWGVSEGAVSQWLKRRREGHNA